MFRAIAFAAGAALLLAAPVEAKRVIMPLTPLGKLVHADLVVVGKVTAIEKDLITVVPNTGARDKVAHQVAIVKIESGLVGADNLTHVKIGFIPPAPGAPPVLPVRGAFELPTPTEGMEGIFYLRKHPSGEFHTIEFRFNPTTTGDTRYKEELALVKRAAAALADPTKALKTDKAADRYFAALVVVTKYRTRPAASEVETVKVPVEESQRVLKALTEGDWRPDPTDQTVPNGYSVFSQLGLTAADGWKSPVVKPNEDIIAKTQEAFVAWLAGPGKGYQISRFAPKTMPKK